MFFFLLLGPLDFLDSLDFLVPLDLLDLLDPLDSLDLLDPLDSLDLLELLVPLADQGLLPIHNNLSDVLGFSK